MATTTAPGFNIAMQMHGDMLMPAYIRGVAYILSENAKIPGSGSLFIVM